jgi:UDP-GlcNAc3NAcA epimerase
MKNFAIIGVAGFVAPRHLKVVHVEAGLRSLNLRMPEEINRILTDRISDVLCCPTDTAVENLRREGFDRCPARVVKTGDVMQDAALHYGVLSAEKSDIVKRLRLDKKDFALCTVHREENTDESRRIEHIVAALNDINRPWT